MKQLIRIAAQTFLPATTYQRIQAVRSRGHQMRYLQSIGMSELTKRYIELYGTVVRRGPFAGMVYPLNAAINRHSIPRLLGSYESELHPWLEQLQQRKYDCVIDIGTAEGYYAVGLARLLRVPVYAFEPEPQERALCELMARLNGVSDLIHMRSLFGASDIADFVSRRALVLCDCEGFEEQIFTPSTVQRVENWDTLVELHGTAIQSLPQLAWKHPVQVIAPAPKSCDAYPELNVVGPPGQMLSEYRAGLNNWMWCARQ
jgi:hypothetical protein